MKTFCLKTGISSVIFSGLLGMLVAGSAVSSAYAAITMQTDGPNAHTTSIGGGNAFESRDNADTMSLPARNGSQNNGGQGDYYHISPQIYPEMQRPPQPYPRPPGVYPTRPGGGLPPGATVRQPAPRTPAPRVPAAGASTMP